MAAARMRVSRGDAMRTSASAGCSAPRFFEVMRHANKQQTSKGKAQKEQKEEASSDSQEPGLMIGVEAAR